MADNDTYITCSAANPDELDFYVSGLIVGKVTSEVATTGNNNTYMTCSASDPDELDTYVDGELISKITSETATTGTNNTYLESEGGETPIVYDVDLLCHFDGADGQQTYTSDDSNARVATFYNAAQLDTAEAYLGVSSLLCDTSNYISFPHSDDFNYTGTQDVTIDVFVKLDSFTSPLCSIVGQVNADSDGNWFIYIFSNGSICVGLTGVSQTSSGDGVFELGAWHHIAIVKYGAYLTIYYDGYSTVTELGGTFLNDSTYPLYVGAIGNGSYPVKGWIDELRITRAARWIEETYTIGEHWFEVFDPVADYDGGMNEKFKVYVDDEKIMEVTSI